MRQARHLDGSVQATAGAAFAGLWIVTIGGRMGFAFGADHWFQAAIATFSRAHEISCATAWSITFILMAITMLVGRALAGQALAAGLKARLPIPSDGRPFHRCRACGAVAGSSCERMASGHTVLA